MMPRPDDLPQWFKDAAAATKLPAEAVERMSPVALKLIPEAANRAGPIIRKARIEHGEDMAKLVGEGIVRKSRRDPEYYERWRATQSLVSLLMAADPSEFTAGDIAKTLFELGITGPAAEEVVDRLRRSCALLLVTIPGVSQGHNQPTLDFHRLDFEPARLMSAHMRDALIGELRRSPELVEKAREARPENLWFHHRAHDRTLCSPAIDWLLRSLAASADHEPFDLNRKRHVTVPKVAGAINYAAGSQAPTGIHHGDVIKVDGREYVAAPAAVEQVTTITLPPGHALTTPGPFQSSLPHLSVAFEPPTVPEAAALMARDKKPRGGRPSPTISLPAAKLLLVGLSLPSTVSTAKVPARDLLSKLGKKKPRARDVPELNRAVAEVEGIRLFNPDHGSYVRLLQIHPAANLDGHYLFERSQFYEETVKAIEMMERSLRGSFLIDRDMALSLKKAVNFRTYVFWCARWNEAFEHSDGRSRFAEKRITRRRIHTLAVDLQAYGPAAQAGNRRRASDDRKALEQVHSELLQIGAFGRVEVKDGRIIATPSKGWVKAKRESE